ncbi:secretory calcium-binding phosphoprotein 5 [Trachinotus anak]|uniref:secretory calcium-binding phosphoprotein 5 n=1 Tax=Trachinotus anak TaxID=443729 RepID=UPI0039F17970
MKLAILCLCLASTASAAPSPFHYLTHYTGSRQQVPPSQVKTPFAAGQPLPQTEIPAAYSVELLYPHNFGGSNAGLPRHGFLKYSIPQPPGRQSVEIYYPYDFSQQKIITSIAPVSNIPQVFQMDYPPPPPIPHIPQQTLNFPSFDANPVPSQDPLQPLQQDQPTQINQMPAKV